MVAELELQRNGMFITDLNKIDTPPAIVFDKLLLSCIIMEGYGPYICRSIY